MKDETDKSMAPEVLPVYEAMRRDLLTKVGANEGWHHNIGYAWANGRKLTLELYIKRVGTESLEEQFEYYDYRYCHRETVPLNAP